jgi:purine-binding chemotaxis protein CheW
MSDLPTTRQLVVFALHGEEYALPIERVREIVRPTRPREIAGAPGDVRGIISLRGQLVPVHDAAVRLGLEPIDGARAKIVVAETESGPLGLLVEEVRGVLTADDGQLSAVPAGGPEGLARIVRADDRLIGLLDLEAAAA